MKLPVPVLAASAVLLAAIFVALACSPGRDSPRPSAARTGLPAEYLGRWYLVGTSGGIEGREVAGPDGSWIVVTASNTIESYAADGQLESTESFVPVRGRSIFSGRNAWILQTPSTVERVVELHPGGVLAISENAYDGFGSTYTRSR